MTPEALTTAVLSVCLTVWPLCYPAAAQCPTKPNANQAGVVAEEVRGLNLDRRIKAMLADFGVTPGLAVGIVSGNELVYARGFGHRDLETCAPVTPDTGFYLLSVTKSFTGMAAALLHEEGKLELDQSIAHYLPDLRMSEEINPAQTSLRDLLMHRPGFWNGAINYRPSGPGNVDTADVIRLLANHSRPYPITFEYSNMGYIVAGAVIETATGLAWDQLLEEKIFQPLGMNSTTTSINKAVAGEFALPYLSAPTGGYERVPYKRQEQMHAAGGAVSTVNDLARWLKVNLEAGQLDGKQVLPGRVVRQAQVPQIQYDWNFYRFRRFGYGLGVHNADYEGDLLIHHFGGWIHLSFMPEHKLGVVVLPNGSNYSTRFSHMLAAYLYDLMLGKPNLDETYAREAAEVKAKTFESIQEREAERRQRLLERTVETPTQPVEAYIGTYISDRLGTMTVRAVGGTLHLDYGVISAKMTPFQKDSFLVQLSYDELPEIFRFPVGAYGETFLLDWGGRIFERQ